MTVLIESDSQLSSDTCEPNNTYRLRETLTECWNELPNEYLDWRCGQKPYHTRCICKVLQNCAWSRVFGDGPFGGSVCDRFHIRMDVHLVVKLREESGDEEVGIEGNW